MGTKAQIGFHETLADRPVAILTQHNDGHPTGKSGVMSELMEICPSLLKRYGFYEPAYLAARTLVMLALRLDERKEDPHNVWGYTVGAELRDATRFYYAVTKEGVHVYDARGMVDEDLGKLEDIEEMFFTAWVNDDERRELEKEIATTDASLKAMKLRLESLKRNGALV